MGPDGRVVAVEANPENARLIAHTMRSTIDNVELVPLALAARRGYVSFGTHVGSNGGFLPDDEATTGSGRDTIVPTMALDDLDLGRVSVVKIDVEGAEGIVIDGAPATIERRRPTFVMEFSQEMTVAGVGAARRSTSERFVDRGYSIAIIDRSTANRTRCSVDELLAGWGDVFRIEDLLLTPT